MPANLPREWYLIEEEYRNAKTREEKIEKLKELIAATPKHKGTENLLAQLRKKLSKLMKEKSKRPKSKQVFKKVGDLLVSIIGLTNSGKSTLLKALTNASVEISEKPFTTKEPVTGVCRWKGVYIQFVEIPSFFLPRDLAIARESDVMVILARNKGELREIERILKENKLWGKKKIIIENMLFSPEKIKGEIERDYSQLLDGIVAASGITRIFLKPKNSPMEESALVFKHKPTVREVVERINKRWLRTFKFARLYKEGMIKRVGLEYELEDGDIVEIHA